MDQVLSSWTECLSAARLFRDFNIGITELNRNAFGGARAV